MSLTRDINNWPALKSTAQVIITSLGPNLSASTPITIAIIPIVKIETEKTPESTALDGLNSAIKGLKKTPKTLCVP